MSGDQPTISISMPVANVRRYLLQAVQSILDQTFTNFELILIDDAGLRDELEQSVAPLRDPRIRVISCAGKGISDALNTGIAASRGMFWCRCDSDDLFPPERLARQLRFLQDNAKYGATCGSMWAMTPAGKFIADMNGELQSQDIGQELARGVCRSSLCTWLVRVDLMRAAGGFRRYFVIAEDIDLQFRLAERTPVWYEAELAYHYRIHQTSITHVQPNARRLFFDAAAREFQRQRKMGGVDALDRGQPPDPPPADASRTETRSRVQDVLVGASWEKHRQGHKADALLLGWRACLAKPSNWQAWRNLAALSLKPPGPGRGADPA